MRNLSSLRALFVVLVMLVSAGAARAQFFIGSPGGGFGTSSGTVTNTPTLFANNPGQEIDVNGQFDVTNATPAVQTSTFSVTCLLDPTFNGGSPILSQLQISQNGFVNVPAGGQIYGWTITADVVDNTGVGMAGASVTALSPAPLYSPGITNYGPTVTPGGTFLYTPATASAMTLRFSSNFDGLSGPNVYTWDFPLSVQLVAVPEPTSLGLLAVGALVLGRRRRTRAAA